MENGFGFPTLHHLWVSLRLELTGGIACPCTVSYTFLAHVCFSQSVVQSSAKHRAFGINASEWSEK